MLSSAKWKPLHLTKLCEEVILGTLQGLFASQAIHLEVVASNTLVDADQAHSLALVLNELATNTVKYGLHDKITGRIRISVKKKDDKIHLNYRDTGAGFPELILQDKFPENCIGLKMITGIIRKNMRGVIHFHTENGGVVDITFPEGDVKNLPQGAMS